MAGKTNLERITALEEQVSTLEAEIATLKESAKNTSPEAIQEKIDKHDKAIRLLVECTKTQNENHVQIMEILGG